MNKKVKTKINPQLTWSLQHATKKSIYHKSSICTNFKHNKNSYRNWTKMKYFRNVYIQYIAIHVLKWVYFSPCTKLADKQRVVKILIDNLSIIRVVWPKTCDFVNSNLMGFFLTPLRVPVYQVLYVWHAVGTHYSNI